MFKYYSSNPFQLEVNEDLKIGRVLLDTDHIADFTPETVVIFHPELFHGIDNYIHSSDVKFEFPSSWYKFQSENQKYDFNQIMTLIKVFKGLIV